MLQLNPSMRMTIKQLLASPVFDEVRFPDMEADAPHKIKLAIDEPGQFNYSKMTPIHSLEDLKKMVEQEAGFIDFTLDTTPKPSN